MRIAQVSLHPDYGGCECHVLMLARGLKEAGHEVALFCHPDGRLRREAENAGLAVRTVRNRNQIDPIAAQRLIFQMLRFRPDVVHLHTPRDFVWGSLAARLARARALVFTRHVTFPVSPLMRRIYQTGDAVVCLAEAVRDMLLAQGLSPEKLVRIQPAINTVPFVHPPPGSRERVRAEWKLPSDAVVVGAVGRLAVGKGQDIFLKAVRQLDACPSVRFLVVGDGPLRESLQQEAAALGIADRVVFTGFRSDMPEIMSALDVFVLASLSELAPLTILEAQAAHCAALATRVGGVGELIDHGVTGMMVSPGDVEALADAMRALIADPVLRDRLAAAGQEKAVCQFSLPRFVREIEALYRRLV